MTLQLIQLAQFRGQVDAGVDFFRNAVVVPRSPSKILVVVTTNVGGGTLRLFKNNGRPSQLLNAGNVLTADVPSVSEVYLGKNDGDLNIQYSVNAGVIECLILQVPDLAV